MNEKKTPGIRFKGFTDDWEQRKLGDVLLDLYNGQTPSRYRDDFWNGNINWLTSGELNRGIVLDTVEKITKEGQNNAHLRVVPSGTFVMAITGLEAAGTRGNCAILGLDTTLNQSCMALFPDKKQLDNLFLFEWYRKVGEEYGNQFTQGTKQQSYNADIVKKLEITLPSVEEQKRIGEFFFGLDNLITLHQREYEKLKIIKKSLLENCFPKNGEKVPKIRFSGFTGDWEQRKFSELFVERRDKTTKENEDTLLSCAITGIYLNSDLFSHFRGSSTVGYLKVKKNDLILSAQNLHLGNANVNLQFEHGIISPAYKVFELIDCDPNFVQTWVKRDETKNFFLAATTEGASQCRKNIEWSTLYNQNIFIPKLQEQVAVGLFFNDLDNLITLHQRKIFKRFFNI